MPFITFAKFLNDARFPAISVKRWQGSPWLKNFCSQHFCQIRFFCSQILKNVAKVLAKHFGLPVASLEVDKRLIFALICFCMYTIRALALVYVQCSATYVIGKFNLKLILMQTTQDNTSLFILCYFTLRFSGNITGT